MEVDACKAYRRLATSSLRKSKPAVPAKQGRPKVPRTLEKVQTGAFHNLLKWKQWQRYLPGFEGKLTTGLLAGLTLSALLIMCRGRISCRKSIRRASPRTKGISRRIGTNRDETISLSGPERRDPATQVRQVRRREVGLAVKLVGLLLVIRLSLAMATPEIVTNNSKQLRCPEFGHLGACRDVCLGQYGSIGLGHVLYLQAVFNVLIGVHFTHSMTEELRKIGSVKHLLSLMAVDIVTTFLIIDLIQSRTPKLNVREILFSNQLVPPFFECNPEPPLYQGQDKLSALWNTYLESCKFNYPRCKVEQPELQTHFIKGHLLVNLSIIMICLLILGQMVIRQCRSQGSVEGQTKPGK